jgi:hypothetical protein
MSNDPTKQPLPTPGQEPPTRAVPQWPAPPPPPPPPPGNPVPKDSPPKDRQDTPPSRPQDAPTARMPRDQPTVIDAAPRNAAPRNPPPRETAQPTQWDQPAQRAYQRQPPTQWQQEPQDTPTAQWSPQPPRQLPPQPPAGGAFQPRPPKRRRVRRSVMALFTVIVLLILLVIADRVALAVTENQFASSFQKNGLPVKPSVTIEGFPFLTQLAAKDFNKVDISASNVPAGPVTITTINATINGMHISGYSSTASAKVDKINASAFISFGALAAAGGLDGTGITVTPDGANTVKITAGVGGLSDTEEAQITQTGAQTITVKVLPSGGVLGSLLGSFGSFSFSLPKGVPASLKITGLTLNSQGLNVTASATNATFSQ